MNPNERPVKAIGTMILLDQFQIMVVNVNRLIQREANPLPLAGRNMRGNLRQHVSSSHVLANGLSLFGDLLGGLPG
jgi:hypothetical protein